MLISSITEERCSNSKNDERRGLGDLAFQGAKEITNVCKNLSDEIINKKNEPSLRNLTSAVDCQTKRITSQVSKNSEVPKQSPDNSNFNKTITPIVVDRVAHEAEMEESSGDNKGNERLPKYV